MIMTKVNLFPAIKTGNETPAIGLEMVYKNTIRIVRLSF